MTQRPRPSSAKRAPRTSRSVTKPSSLPPWSLVSRQGLAAAVPDARGCEPTLWGLRLQRFSCARGPGRVGAKRVFSPNGVGSTPTRSTVQAVLGDRFDLDRFFVNDRTGHGETAPGSWTPRASCLEYPASDGRRPQLEACAATHTPVKGPSHAVSAEDAGLPAPGRQAAERFGVQHWYTARRRAAGDMGPDGPKNAEPCSL